MKERNVEFYSMGTKIVGRIYLPDDYKEGKQYPCVITCSGFTGINAVYPALFSRLLTKHGYACLGFDYRGWAPSEGEVGVTTYESEYEDITSAYVFAQQQPEFDVNNISLFGWGMSGPIVIKIGVDNPKIKSVAIGNSFANGERMMRTCMSIPEYERKAEQARQDQIARVLTGTGEYINCYRFNSETDADTENDYLQKTLNHLTDDIDAIVIQNYGAKENFPPKHSWMYFDSTLRVNAEDYVRKLAPRGLFLGGSLHDTGYSFYETECLYAAAGEGKVLYAVDGGHNDWMFDDDPRFIDFGTNLVAFYDSYMK